MKKGFDHIGIPTHEPHPGESWAILTQGLGIKKYPTCYCTHRAIDCMLDLVNATPIRADEVKKVTVNISDYFATVLRNHQPETGLSGSGDQVRSRRSQGPGASGDDAPEHASK